MLYGVWGTGGDEESEDGEQLREPLIMGLSDDEGSVGSEDTTDYEVDEDDAHMPPPISESPGHGLQVTPTPHPSVGLLLSVARTKAANWGLTSICLFGRILFATDEEEAICGTSFPKDRQRNFVAQDGLVEYMPTGKFVK